MHSATLCKSDNIEYNLIHSQTQSLYDILNIKIGFKCHTFAINLDIKMKSNWPLKDQSDAMHSLKEAEKCVYTGTQFILNQINEFKLQLCTNQGHRQL